MPRSRVEWGVLAVAVGIAGYFGATFSLAQVMAGRNVELAYALAPYDGRIAARRAAALAGPDATAADRRRADRLARAALRNDPTAVAAVSTLGIDAQIGGDTRTARRMFAYSQTLSRRDLQTQLWAIEDAVGRGDVIGALRHYDIALRTTPTASEILYPVLATAAADPLIRGALVRTLRGRPSWGESFVDHIAVHGPDARATVRLFASLRRAGVAVPESASTSLVNALIAGGFLADAWTYYAVIRPGADRRTARDPRFVADLATPSLLDWTPINDAGISTSIARADRGGVFYFAAPAGVGGTLLQQVQMLPPGDYRLDGHGAAIDQLESAQPYWVLKCGDGRELGRVALPATDRAKRGFTGRFSVPSGCSVQTLALVARPSDAVAGLSGRIDRVQLSPAHRAGR